MPFECEVKIDEIFLRVIYEERHLDLEAGVIEQARALRMRVPVPAVGADRTFLLRCLAGGLGVAVVGTTGWLLKDIIKQQAVSLFAPGSAIYQVLIPSLYKKEFSEFVSGGELLSDIRKAFENIEERLASILGDELETHRKIIQQLADVKIASVEICEEKDALSAFEKMYTEPLVEKTKTSHGILEAPKNLVINEGPKACSVFVAFDTASNADGYIVKAHDLGNGEVTKTFTKDSYCVIDNLQPGRLYIFKVCSVRGEERSAETVNKQPVLTALFGRYPLRDADDIGSVAESGVGESIATSESIDQPSDTAEEGLPDLWKSAVHSELLQIFPRRFDDKRMKRLLSKCYELGIVEATDLKFVKNEKVADALEGSIKMVEILKLVEYAKDQYRYYSSSMEQRKGGNGVGISIINSGMINTCKNAL